jgi:hypothetical protein
MCILYKNKVNVQAKQLTKSLTEIMTMVQNNRAADQHTYVSTEHELPKKLNKFVAK